jgi:hypothetical protein
VGWFGGDPPSLGFGGIGRGKGWKLLLFIFKFFVWVVGEFGCFFVLNSDLFDYSDSNDFDFRFEI